MLQQTMTGGKQMGSDRLTQTRHPSKRGLHPPGCTSEPIHNSRTGINRKYATAGPQNLQYKWKQLPYWLDMLITALVFALDTWAGALMRGH